LYFLNNPATQWPAADWAVSILAWVLSLDRSYGVNGDGSIVQHVETDDPTPLNYEFKAKSIAILKVLRNFRSNNKAKEKGGKREK
jgi:hypothetical protein